MSKPVTQISEKTISELLADVGVQHVRIQRGNGLHRLSVADGAHLDDMDAHGAVLFLQAAECAA